MQVVKTPAENSYLIFDKGNFLSIQGLLYKWTEHLIYILPMTNGGGFLTLIMLHKLTQSL